MDNRNHSNDELRQLVSKLTDGERTLLRVGGALPVEFQEENLTGADISRMIGIIEDGGVA